MYSMNTPVPAAAFRLRLPTFALLVGLLAGPATLSGAVPPPEKLLPASTLAMASIPDYSKFSAGATNDPMYRFLRDPAMKPMVDKFIAKWNTEVVARIEQQFGIKLSDYAQLAQGQITLALLKPAPDAKEGGLQPFVFLMDAGSQAEALKKILADLRKRWIDSGKKLRSEPIRGVEFSALTFTAAELDKALESFFPKSADSQDEDDKEKGKEKDKDEADGKKTSPSAASEWFVGQSETLLLFANSGPELEKVLALQAGASTSALAEVPGYATHRGSLFGDSSFYLWANLQEVIGVVKKSLEAAAGDRRRADAGPSPVQILEATGLGALRSLAFSARPSPEGAFHDLRVEIPESDRQGLVKLFSFEAKDASPPAFVPQDVLDYTRTRIDMLKGFETLEAAVVKLFPQSASFIKLIMDTTGKEKDPNFDLRKNLIGNLGDDYVSYSKTPADKTLLATAPSIHLIGARNAEQLMSALKTLTAFMPPQAGKREREFLGRQVFSLTMPGTKQSLSFVNSGGYLAIANDDTILEEFLRSSEQKAKPLAALPGLAEDAQKVSGMGTGSFSYSNLKEATRLQFEVMKKESGTLANFLAASTLGSKLGLDEDSSVMKSWVDFSLLPPFEKVSQYFHHSLYTWSFAPSGLELRSFTPVPPELKK